MNGDMINSRQEVIETGKKVVEDLHSLQEKLSIAEKRRVFRKYSSENIMFRYRKKKFDEIVQLTRAAKVDLVHFQKGLKTISIPLALRMEVGSFILFVEFFFDGNIEQHYIMEDISVIKEQISDAIINVPLRASFLASAE